MKKITMYTGPLCNYCEAAKRLLARNNAPYNEIDISKVAGAADEMIKKANGKKNTLRLPAFLIADFIHLQDSITNESKITFQQGPLNISVLNSSFYIVQDGDTVWDIAAKYNGISVADIKSLNRNLDISKVKKGDRIVISAH